jgi:hypothetical protein
VAGSIGEAIVPNMLVVPGDAATTAHNITTNDLLFRLGFVAYIVEALTDVALTFFLYVLLRPVRGNLAFSSVLFRLMATATFAFGEIFYFAQAQILRGDAYLNTFSNNYKRSHCCHSTSTEQLAAYPPYSTGRARSSLDT